MLTKNFLQKKTAAEIFPAAVFQVNLIPKRFAGFKHVGHTILAQLFAA